MIQAYIDVEALKSFFESKNHPNFKYCLEIFQTRVEMKFLFSEENIKEDEELQMLMNQLSDGCDTPENYDYTSQNKNTFNNIPFSFIKNKYDKTNYPIKELMSLFFINSINTEDKLILHNLVWDKGNSILEKLSKLYYRDRQYYQQICRPSKLTNWDVFSQYALPLTDIILVDPYISSNKDRESFNIVPLIRNLCKNIHDTSINIIIFSEPRKDKSKNIIRLNRKEGTGIIDGFSESKKLIEEALKSKRLTSINLTYIETEELKEHDRTIFTNYCYYECAGSFSDIFKSNGENVSNSRFFKVFSHLDPDNMEDSLYLLKDLQEVINSTKSLIKKDGQKRIWGCEESFFLNFKP